MWNEISSGNDLVHFLDSICSFHDSCIKEIKYISGAFVNDDLVMHPINDRRVLRVIIQRQFKDNSMIEMEFEGLKYLKLFPTDVKYTCELLDSAMFFRDGYIYWCDSGCNSESEVELHDYVGTIICASKFRWRPIRNSLGAEDFYVSTE